MAEASSFCLKVDDNSWEGSDLFQCMTFCCWASDFNTFKEEIKCGNMIKLIRCLY